MVDDDWQEEPVRLDQASEQRVQVAFQMLLDAFSGLGDVEEAARSFLGRGDPNAPPLSVGGVLADMLVSLWWLGFTLGVDMREEFGRALSEHQTRGERARDLDRMEYEKTLPKPPPFLSESDRCMILLASGVALRRDAAIPPQWRWSKASFPDSVVQGLLETGIATTRDDGASSTFLIITRRGLAEYQRRSEEKPEEHPTDSRNGGVGLEALFRD